VEIIPQYFCPPGGVRAARVPGHPGQPADTGGVDGAGCGGGQGPPHGGASPPPAPRHRPQHQGQSGWVGSLLENL
jgi:hypothetical protein